eukprot:GHVR01191078.1.p1 GENE.GHVR01191078.1~~GHVR01191078.1.p1  ORF type:complete len:788 (+),score=152.20 GHVR01191078.1:73-2436(+)
MGKDNKVSSGKIGGPFIINNNENENEFIKHRIDLFDKLYKQQLEELSLKPKIDINIELPDGTIKTGTSWVTTPLDIAKGISKGLANSVIVARVLYKDKKYVEDVCRADIDNDTDSDGDDCDECCCGNGVDSNSLVNKGSILWDLTRVLEGDCKLWLLKFDNSDSKEVFWHSSAHILGCALEKEFGALLTMGPALASGFYYDCYMGDSVLTQDCFKRLEEIAESITKEALPYQRLVLTKDNALLMFKHNPFKLSLINAKVSDGSMTSCYRCGTLVDLCRGPHLPTTAAVKAFKCIKNSSAYWLGSNENDSLQRVYGISFEEKKQLTEYTRLQAEAERRDHRTVGVSQDLFFFSPGVSAGSCFWLPDGTYIYNRLVDMLRNQYQVRGFKEVITPNMFSCELWKTSGHLDKYAENMYTFNVEGQLWGLKPMNCPAACVMFRHIGPSYRQMPVRLADFGVLHRNELSGSLCGLTRVRRFQQDDAHIFCRLDQVEDEVAGALDFLLFVYDVFNFQYELKLSTRPKNRLGDDSLWDTAEGALKNALIKAEKPFTINKGDGAFYGPKIDICLYDALQRAHQCGTIQLDFQLPIRFNLSYKTEEVVTHEPKPDTQTEKQPETEKETEVQTHADSDITIDHLKPGHARPVIVHRAVLGSLERIIAVLTEHYGGRWPLWLSPRQVIICPVSAKYLRYGEWVRSTLHSKVVQGNRVLVSMDNSDATLKKKIAKAQGLQYNFILVVGQEEEDTQTVTLRHREKDTQMQKLTMQELLSIFDTEGKLPGTTDFEFKPYVPL